MGSLLNAPEENLLGRSASHFQVSSDLTKWIWEPGTYGWKNVSVIRPHDVSAWFDSWFKGVVYGGSAGVRSRGARCRYVLQMAYW